MSSKRKFSACDKNSEPNKLTKYFKTNEKTIIEKAKQESASKLQSYDLTTINNSGMCIALFNAFLNNIFRESANGYGT